MMIKMTIMIVHKQSKEVFMCASLPNSAYFHARAIWLSAIDAALHCQYILHMVWHGLRKIDINLTTNLQQRVC